MAKSKYETHVLPKLDQIEEWAKSGLIDTQIAKNLGISKDSFYKYKTAYIAFSDALKRGKEVIDLEVENALLKRALGYKYEEITKEPIKNNPTQLQITKQVTKEVLPDVTAQIFWLKNRRPEDWRDKKEIFSSGSNTIQISLED
ncbi:MAG: transposase [Clostridium sp.]|uniref:transposase n=1 Tax=Clostridium sp. TaxID=1506 RepID=UPI0029000BD7|nr:transposase [Clostridium sp.]MDU2895701.1 transposase [Clostridium sp.]MDU3008093.1 transposase [Clostridium sp.]MDU3037958.1 transposase [Clostridium sp.]MDU3052926.1 transposase [Clostridium sp.]